ncbi:MAG: hypothetical protein ACHQ4H_00485 [Ktedonobacterales bacterium]
MTPDAALAALRLGGDAAAASRTLLAHSADDADMAASAAGLRAAVAPQLAGSLRPADRDIARWLLEQEIAVHESAGHGASETLYTLVAAVARYADPDDVLLLWRARNATPQTRAGVDVEQLARPGVERVRRRLATLARTGNPQSAAAAQALDWLESGLAGGAGDDLPGYFAWADERFGLHVSGPT